MHCVLFIFENTDSRSFLPVGRSRIRIYHKQQNEAVSLYIFKQIIIKKHALPFFFHEQYSQYILVPLSNFFFNQLGSIFTVLCSETINKDRALSNNCLCNSRGFISKNVSVRKIIQPIKKNDC